MTKQMRAAREEGTALPPCLPYDHERARRLMAGVRHGYDTLWDLHVGGMPAQEIARRMMWRKVSVVKALCCCREALRDVGMEIP